MAQYIEHPALRGASEANAFSRQQRQQVGAGLMQAYGALNEAAQKDADRIAQMNKEYAYMTAGFSPSGAPMNAKQMEKVQANADAFRNAQLQYQEQIQRNMMRRAGRNLQGEVVGPSSTPVTEQAAFLTSKQTAASHPWMAQQAVASNYGRAPLTYAEQQQLQTATGIPTQEANSWWRQLVFGRQPLEPGQQPPPQQPPPPTPPVIGPNTRP